MLCHFLCIMGKTIYCASNGSPVEFPQNSLTYFGNKLPFFYDFQKNDDLNFHIALNGVGFSVDFERHFVPNHLTNPSIIIAESYHERTAIQPSSKCLSLNNEKDRNCNIPILDMATKIINHQNDKRFLYVYLDSEDLTYPKMAKFLLDLNKNTYMKAEYIKEKEIINFKSSDVVSYLFLNVKLLEHLKANVKYLVDLGSVEYMKFKRKLYSTFDDILKNSVNINGDLYFAYRVNPNFTYVEISLSSLLKPNYPKIVKIRCENIRDQIYNEKHAKDLAIFCPEIVLTQNFFWHEFDAKTYCVLENTLLNDISFKLVDEHNEQLLLKTGIPTILKIDIQAMPKYKKSFNVRVTSDKQALHQENTRSNFNVTLPQTLYLNENWKVALSSINLPNIFNTLPQGDQILGFLCVENGVTKKIEHLIPQKNYTKEEFIAELNFFLQKNSENV